MMPRWLIWTLAALVCWGGWALLSKLIGDALTPAQSQAMSTIGILPVMAAVGFTNGVRDRKLWSRGALLAFIAGILTCLGNVAYYAALNNSKAATLVPLTAMYPLVTVVLAIIFLREKVNGIQIVGIAVSLIAIYLFNVGSSEGFLSPWLVTALIPILLWGVSGLVQKISTNTISGELSALWFLAAFVPVGVVLAFPKLPLDVGGKTFALAILLGLSFALGNLALLQAFASGGKASVIAPVAGLYPAVSIPIAIFGLGERTTMRESLGIALALAAVGAISFETKSNDEKSDAIDEPGTGPR